MTTIVWDDAPASEPITSRVGLPALMALTCRAHGVEPEELTGPSRMRHLVEARRDFARRARAAAYSFPAIGRALSRDHTTIIDLVYGRRVRP